MEKLKMISFDIYKNDIVEFINTDDLDDISRKIEIKELPNYNIEVDIDRAKKEINAIIAEYRTNRGKSDGEVAYILWKNLKSIPNYLWINRDIIAWLTYEFRDYIKFRFSDKVTGEVGKDRILPEGRGRNRHTITRLYWGAKLANGDPNLIKKLFADQDLSVAILERAWSHKLPFVKWFFEFMDKQIVEIYFPYEKNRWNESIFEFTNLFMKRMMIKIFYSFASQSLYDEWTQEEFNKTLIKAGEYCLDLYFDAITEYTKISKTNKKVMKKTDFIKQVAKLNSRPFDVKDWVMHTINQS